MVILGTKNTLVLASNQFPAGVPGESYHVRTSRSHVPGSGPIYWTVIEHSQRGRIKLTLSSSASRAITYHRAVVKVFSGK